MWSLFCTCERCRQEWHYEDEQITNEPALVRMFWRWSRRQSLQLSSDIIECPRCRLMSRESNCRWEWRERREQSNGIDGVQGSDPGDQ
jgi:hypothetical protein